MPHEPFHIAKLYGSLPNDIEGLDELTELALDMRWSWNHEADALWSQLDPDLWELTHNHWILLQTVSRDQFIMSLGNKEFRKKMNELIELKARNISREAWFQKKHPQAPLTGVAYFSMEFMLDEALPIYVGGLGNVAGDQLKSASDLGVPVFGIGLLFQQGYFHQEIDPSGNQKALFPYNDPGQLPVTPLRTPNGEWVRIRITLSGFPVWLRTWQVQVGRVRLFLLDSNDLANLPEHRGITNELYGGGPETRIQQEIILGIGGWKLLQTLGITPEVCHMNEGHAAFLVLERAAEFMTGHQVPFHQALAVTRAGNLFTTHTAVAAGFDHFSPALMWQFFGSYATQTLGIDFNALLALGRQDPNNFSEAFNMAFLAIRGSGAVNGVSQLHAEVSRNLFSGLFPRWPIAEVPVGAVTNGVHMPSWDSEIADRIWTHACGKDRWRGGQETLGKDISTVSNQDLWDFRNVSRKNLVSYVRSKYGKYLYISPLLAEMTDKSDQIFDPSILTLGFARRFVPYKRPNLLLHDPQRLIRILTNPSFPVQLVIAGKAPPFDEPGKALIRQWVLFIQEHHLQQHVIFLSDYDMVLTQQLVQGVDVWINTPRRPWEACGTSGMKVLVNGGINLSELDGWWAEAYSPKVGWALGDGREHEDHAAWDAVEAEALYDLLENQVVPEFYERDGLGIPQRWVSRIRQSMASLTPRFSANRTVREYTEKYYLAAAKNYLKRAADQGMVGKKILEIHNELQNNWGGIRFEKVEIAPVPGGYNFKVNLNLNGIDRDFISVELYAEAVQRHSKERILMAEKPSHSETGAHLFEAEVKTQRPSEDYTVRLYPHYLEVVVPLEDQLIVWQR